MAGVLPIQKTNIMNDKHLERTLNNTFPEVVDVYITLDNGQEYRVFKKADPAQMEKQEKDKIEELEQDLIELEKQHEESLKVAFDKAYQIGLKDGLMSDEKFQF